MERFSTRLRIPEKPWQYSAFMMTQTDVFYEKCTAFECLPMNELKCWDSVRLDFRTYLTYFHLATLGCLSITGIIIGLLFGIKTFAQDGQDFLKNAVHLYGWHFCCFELTGFFFYSTTSLKYFTIKLFLSHLKQSWQFSLRIIRTQTKSHPWKYFHIE